MFTTPEELVARIEAAFPDVPYSNPDLACSHDYDESLELDKELRSKNWTQFTPTECRYMQEGIALFSAEAFAYFLPAYMRASIIDAEEADVVTDYVAWKYLPPDAKSSAFRDLRFLTQDQQWVLLNWLEWWLLGEEAREGWFLRQAPNGDQARDRRNKEIAERLTRNRRQLQELHQQFREGGQLISTE